MRHRGRAGANRTESIGLELLTLNKVDLTLERLATVWRAPLKRRQAFSRRCLSTSSSAEDASSTARALHGASKMWGSAKEKSQSWDASVEWNPRTQSTRRECTWRR